MKSSLVYSIAVFSFVLGSCKKDNAPVLESDMPDPPTIWEEAAGDYKVYDTTGVFLYDMEVVHTETPGPPGYNPIDSLFFHNFDGQFDLAVYQSNFGIPSNFISTGVQTAILDTNGNRWNLFCLGSNDTLNALRNDTLIMYVEKHNTPYWINDGTFYYHTNLKHVAVKQH